MPRRPRRHPFLLLALLGLMAFGAVILAGLDPAGPAGTAALWLFRTAGFGFHASANLLARHVPWLPDWLDVVGVLMLGFAPYLLADLLWRRLRRD